MTLRKTTALLAAAASTMTGAALLATPAQAATTDTCYVVDVRDYYPGENTFRDLTSQAMDQGKAAGLSVDGIANRQFLACGGYYQVNSVYRYNSLVSGMERVSATSTQVATFRIYIAPSSVITIPERSPMFLAMERARAAGLEIVPDDEANFLYVKGTAAKVYGAFDPSVYWVSLA